MTTTAATWFYHPPANRPYLLAERLRTSFWDQRLGALWLEVERAEAPCVAAGHMDNCAVRLEWQPAEWLRLTTQPEAAEAAHSVTYLLVRKPTLRYTTTAGETVWEWWLQPAAADRRWQELQGNPNYGSPARLIR